LSCIASSTSARDSSGTSRASWTAITVPLWVPVHPMVGDPPAELFGRLAHRGPDQLHTAQPDGFLIAEVHLVVAAVPAGALRAGPA
jgi:hypothetical protein